MIAKAEALAAHFLNRKCRFRKLPWSSTKISTHFDTTLITAPGSFARRVTGARHRCRSAMGQAKRSQETAAGRHPSNGDHHVLDSL
jgi:hypothetical protein